VLCGSSSCFSFNELVVVSYSVAYHPVLCGSHSLFSPSVNLLLLLHFMLCCLPSGTLLFILLLLLFHNIQCALLPTTHVWILISSAIFLALQVVSCSGAYFLVLGALLVFYLLVFLSINLLLLLLLLLLLFHDVHTLQLKVINSNYSAFLTVFVIVLLYQEREREREGSCQQKYHH
jgi:hypothetical protein